MVNPLLPVFALFVLTATWTTQALGAPEDIINDLPPSVEEDTGFREAALEATSSASSSALDGEVAIGVGVESGALSPPASGTLKRAHYFISGGLSWRLFEAPGVEVGLGTDMDFQYPTTTQLPTGAKSSHLLGGFFSYITNTLFETPLWSLELGPQLGWQWGQANFPLATLSHQGPLIGFSTLARLNEPLFGQMWGLLLGVKAIGPLGTYRAQVQEEQPRAPLDPSALNPDFRAEGGFRFVTITAKILTFWKELSTNRQQALGVTAQANMRLYQNLAKDRFDGVVTASGTQVQENTWALFLNWSYKK